MERQIERIKRDAWLRGFVTGLFMTFVCEAVIYFKYGGYLL